MILASARGTLLAAHLASVLECVTGELRTEEMIKKAQYWREFTAATRDEAAKAAETWWSEQSGVDKVSGWVLPAGDPAADRAAAGWTATIIYRSSPAPEPVRPELERPTLH